ncbi:MAG: hypothetical protein KAS29_13095, partial [Bacteroidales bacterium]|nr:hypothetical protein [Bacteroidales bacterium]
MKEKSISYLVVVLLVLLGSCNSRGTGCTDAQARNMDASAIENDGSCTYDPVWVGPDKTMVMSELVSGTSGLICWDGLLWTHNDHTDISLYGLDTATAEISREYLLPDVVNTNWEDIAEDGKYLYVGDFGNNASGDRTDLHILCIELASLKLGNPSIDTIWFSYSDQHDLSPSEPNQTEFDCEAFVVSSEHIYLFTKRWLSGQTALYVLEKQIGNQVAQKKANFDIQG